MEEHELSGGGIGGQGMESYPLSLSALLVSALVVLRTVFF